MCRSKVSTVSHIIGEVTVLGNTIIGVGSKGAIEDLNVLCVVGVGSIRAVSAFLLKEEN